MGRQAYVHQEDCVGCELCTKICTAFQIGSNGKAEFLAKPNVAENEIQDAINNCPAQCITWKN